MTIYTYMYTFRDMCLGQKWKHNTNNWRFKAMIFDSMVPAHPLSMAAHSMAVATTMAARAEGILVVIFGRKTLIRKQRIVSPTEKASSSACKTLSITTSTTWMENCWVQRPIWLAFERLCTSKDAFSNHVSMSFSDLVAAGKPLLLLLLTLLLFYTAIRRN